MNGKGSRRVFITLLHTRGITGLNIYTKNDSKTRIKEESKEGREEREEETI